MNARALALRDAIPVPSTARAMGIGIVGSRGSGKTRLKGRLIVPHDFATGVPTIVIDPLGGLADEIFDKFSRTFLPREQAEVWRRVRYVDMAGVNGYVTPLPLYFQAPGDSLYDASQRFPDVVQRLDRQLREAPVMGWNAFWPLATNVGMILTALGWQITEAEDLVLQPTRYTGKLEALAQERPEVAPAVRQFVDGYTKAVKRDQQNMRGAFLTKIGMFALDPVMRAMFGASRLGVDLDEVERRRELVIFDFGGIRDEQRRRFLLMWVFRLLIDFIKRRGVGKHLQPISLVIDEMTYLLASGDTDLLNDDLEELINRLSRNGNVWLTLSVQELHQLSPQLARTFLTLGTLFFGVTSSVESAETIAARFSRYNPYRVKKTDNVWMSDPLNGPYVVDHTTTEFTMDEQLYEASRAFMDLPPFTFMVGHSTREGMIPTELRRASIAGLDAGLFPNPEVTAEVKRLLSQRSGSPIFQVLEEISRRVEGPVEKDDRKLDVSLDEQPATEVEPPVEVEVPSDELAGKQIKLRRPGSL